MREDKIWGEGSQLEEWQRPLCKGHEEQKPGVVKVGFLPVWGKPGILEKQRSNDEEVAAIQLSLLCQMQNVPSKDISL